MAPFFFHLVHSQWFITPPLPQTTFAGKTVIVTGGNSGLGREAARHIVRLGASRVIIAGRNPTALEEARQDIMATTGSSSDVIDAWQLDLCSYESVVSFATRANTQLPRLDILLENAGMSTTEFRMAERDESTITTNVVSKLLEILAVREMIKTSALPGYPVVINLVNAGFCYSNLTREGPQAFMTVMRVLIHARSSEVGSRTLVHAASAGEETHGADLSDCRLSPVAEFVTSEEGKEMQARVWSELSQKLEDISPGVTKIREECKQVWGC
jgi:NAD(P)-dependent dehydrogenase (short-subunit alcohol dehydrogenase family)